MISIKKPGWIIKSVIAVSEAFFEGGSFIVQPIGSSNLTSEVTINIKKEKFTIEQVDLKILMGPGANAPHFIVHNEVVTISKFDFMMPLSNEELHYRFPQTH